MKRYDWTSWDLPITKIRIYYGHEAAEQVMILAGEPYTIEIEEDY